MLAASLLHRWNTDTWNHVTRAVRLDNVVAQWIFEFAVVFAMLKFARLTVLFEPMITAFVKDDADPDETPLAEAPRVDVTALEARRRANAG